MRIERIERSDGLYLRRWVLFEPRRRWVWGSLAGWRLLFHEFHRVDEDECFHDHPWRFWTLVLWGGYEEETPDGHRRTYPGRVYYRPAKYRHKITRLFARRVYTLVVTAPRERAWGFIPPHALHRWIHWKSFTERDRKGRLDWCRMGRDD